jgi:hypothetical protein
VHAGNGLFFYFFADVYTHRRKKQHTLYSLENDSPSGVMMVTSFSCTPHSIIFEVLDNLFFFVVFFPVLFFFVNQFILNWFIPIRYKHFRELNFKNSIEKILIIQILTKF